MKILIRFHIMNENASYVFQTSFDNQKYFCLNKIKLVLYFGYGGRAVKTYYLVMLYTRVWIITWNISSQAFDSTSSKFIAKMGW